MAASRGPLAPEAGRGVGVRVRLTPKAATNRIKGIGPGAGDEPVVKVQVTAAPEGGKANAALIKLLAKAWRVPKTSVSVVRGATDRSKTLLVEGDERDLMQRLTEWMEKING